MTAAADFDLSISLWPITDLAPYKRNARTHPQKQIDQIKGLIRQYGFTSPIIADRDGGGVIAAGHGRLISVQQMLADGETIKLPDGRALPDGYLPVIDCSGWTEDQRRAYTLADNQVAENSEWDTALLGLELDDLAQIGFDAGDLGFDPGDLKKVLGADGSQSVKGSLADRFGVPPFSVLSAREGWWQDRKRAWLALGIESEIGRDIAPTSVPDNLPDDHYMANRGNNAGGSIFDPVLCELAYRWFSKAGDVVLDPFAGGSVRGVVAAILGRQYHGIDLRAEQIEANVAQWADMDQDDVPAPQWYVGDAVDAPALVDGMQADFIFSCPPYADL